MSSGADITIVIPVWGPSYVALLPDLVAAFERQTLQPARIVIVDNSAPVPLPDLRGVEIMRAPRRLSTGDARNLGLMSVETCWVQFWDADDLPMEGMPERLRSRLDSDPGLIAAASPSLGWNPITDERFRWPWPRSLTYRLARRPKLLALSSLFTNPFPTAGATLLSTEAVRHSGGFLNQYPEDWYLSAAMAIRGPIGMLTEPGRLYRVHEGSISATLTPQEYLSGLMVMLGRIRADAMTPTWLRPAIALARLYHRLRTSRWSTSRAGPGFYADALERSGSKG